MSPHKSNPKISIIPDNSNWTDKGCELFHSCLNCPLPRCIEEKPRGKQMFKISTRARKIKELKNLGKTTYEIALKLHISQRTVQRALKASGGTRND